MAEIVALPQPMDESGLKSDLMESARLACEHGEILAYGLVVMFADGSWSCHGEKDFDGALGPMSGGSFAVLAGEALKSHFIGAPIARSRLDADEEC